MNWPAEFGPMSESDLEKVFRYTPQPTTVVCLQAGEPTPRLWSLEGIEDWNMWLHHERPHYFDGQPCTVLVLARREGEHSSLLKEIDSGAISFGDKDVDGEFLGVIYDDKIKSHRWPANRNLLRGTGTADSERTIAELQGGGREVQRIPLEKDLFEEICEALFIHPSIARAISRADTPLFSRAYLKAAMHGQNTPSIVYNCRSANLWKRDLALTVTHFPDLSCTFGMLFGCTADIERKVLNRLAGSMEYCRHPLLLPGIFAELERERMLKVVDVTTRQVEEMIFELDTGVGTYALKSDANGGARSERRDVWLHATFLRNRLEIWRQQLVKMADHADELSSTDPLPVRGAAEPLKMDEAMIEANRLIKDRLKDLTEEFQQHTEDCTMRVEGMSMATQWSNADINVDIALAAGNDSNQMRSISLVTMVFLPGTFFATFFSMTFFDWSPSESESVVSSYIWIYVAITGACTFLTLLAWGYFVGFRRQKGQQIDSDAMV